MSTNSVIAADTLDNLADEVFQSLMSQHDVPGLALAVIADGKTQFFNYGVASRTGGAKVDEDTIFEIGSISKIFTATLGAHAVVTGRMHLDDHPSKYLSWVAGTDLDNATLANLATYTAGGLPLQFPDGVREEDDIQAYFSGWKADAPPGTQRRYSNPSIGLFGRVTAVALGDDFRELVQRHVIEPLSMESTFVDVPEEVMDRYAWGHRNGSETRVNPGPLATEAYGIKSTTSDLARLVQANLNPAAFEQPLRQAIEATHLAYFEVGPMRQGLGWEQYPYPVDLERLVAGNSPAISAEANAASMIAPPTRPEGPTLLNKTGSTLGFGGYVAFIPAYRIGVVMLANRNYPVAARVEAAHRILGYLADQR